MQAVSQLYQYSPYVVVHGVQHLLKVVQLLRHGVALLLLLSHHAHQERHVLTEHILYVLYRRRCVFHHVVQESRTHGCSTQLQLLRHYQRHCYRVYYVWFARLASLLVVSLLGTHESLLHQLHLLLSGAILHGREHLISSAQYLFFCNFVQFHKQRDVFNYE